MSTAATRSRRTARAAEESDPSLPPPSGAKPPSVEEPAPANPPETLSADEERFIGELETLWGPHAKAGLEVRHQMGAMLNAKLGADIQPRGEEVIKAAAARLDVNVSDLYRSKSFARRYSSFEQFAEENPTIQSWAGVKRLLAELNKAEKSPRSGNGQGTDVAADKASAKAKGELIALMAEVREKLKIVAVRSFSLEEFASFDETLTEFATALQPTLGTLNLKSIAAIAAAIKKPE